MHTLKIGAKSYQTAENFGVSGAWWAQDVGGYETVRDEIARLLFSRTEGIGISCYRYNMGGGSKNSRSSKFHNENRMAECFLKSDGTYDFTRDKNAVYMMKKAVEYGCEEIILFVNSPPEIYTKNHKSCLDTPWFTNLRLRDTQKFAQYCVKVAEHFVSEGVPVSSVSPVNEPVWVWTEKHGQEGCHYRPWGVRAVMRTLSDAIESSNILNGKVLISGAENGDLRWFNKTYTRIMLGDEKIRRHSDGIDVHSYFLPMMLPKPFNNRLAYMKRWRRYLDKHFPNDKVRISEWTHMQGGRDCSMNSALLQARTMYEDLTVLNAVSWQHWIAVSDVNYCDGIIYINPDKSYEVTKRYYAFGNFSKFVERGAVRVEMLCSDGDLLTVGYRKGGKTTVIIINETHNTHPLDFSSISESGGAYITDCDSSLEYREISGRIDITPHSVTTLVLEEASK